jgi:Xaa-Pro aminopeptidase
MQTLNNSTKARLQRVQTILKKQSVSSALLLSSASETPSSRDQFHSFRQDSDFYYLTRSLAKNSAILISGKHSRPIFFQTKADRKKIIWEGATENPKKIASCLGCDLVISDDLTKEIKSKLSGIEQLFFQNAPSSLAWKIASTLIQAPSHSHSGLPRQFSHSDLILERLRLFKDKLEIELITKAIEITYEAMRLALSLVADGASERDISSSIEYAMALAGAEPAFNNIVAAGKNAATLHYHDLNSILKKQDLLLIDIGARYMEYCGDITRVFPVRGTFDEKQKTFYEIVLASQKAAINKIRHGVLIKDVYDAAARVLTEGLIELSVLKGKASTLFSQGAYKPYFPHGIGHSLGIDVHDIGNLRGNNNAILEAGMVFTVEPGLYFSKRTKSGIIGGVRIEDDVLVTMKGCRVLSDFIPKEVKDVQELMGI